MTCQPTETLIQIASELKEHVASWLEVYMVLPAVIEKEHRAIRDSDYATVEVTHAEKAAQGERVEACFSSLMRAGERLGRMRADLTATPAVRPVTLTDCVRALEDCCATLPADALGSQVLRHLADGLAKQVAEIEERHRHVKPLVEANRHLVTRMLTNFQESYRFWQEVQERVALGYNGQGVQETTGRVSGFRAKA
jgi:hypothetical protein